MEQFIFTSWSIFVITALKSFSDNSNTCHLGWHLLIFFSHAIFVLAFNQLGYIQAAPSNQSSVDYSFSVSYVFKGFSRFQICAVVHHLVQILKVSGVLFSIREHMLPQEWSRSSQSILWDSLPVLFTLYHLPGTCWFPGAPCLSGPLARTMGLCLPCCVLHSNTHV